MLLQNGKFEDVDAKKMIGVISRTLNEHVFTVGQKFAIEFCGNNYLVAVGGISSSVMRMVKETSSKKTLPTIGLRIREGCSRRLRR